MGLTNLKLRGGTYHWRRKVTIQGVTVPLMFSLGTGSHSKARGIADRLGAALEKLRVGYGEHTGIKPAQIKKVFSDAMRWQLQRILSDQAGSGAPLKDHATENSVHAEAWDFLARKGVDARWNLDEHERLIGLGWPQTKAKAVANALFSHSRGAAVSREQIKAYLKAFEIPDTTDNIARVVLTVLQARAAACREASNHLPDESEKELWVADAMRDDGPFAFEILRAADDTASGRETRRGVDEPPISPASSGPHSVPTAAESDTARLKMLLLDAGKECIAAHERAKAWSDDTIKQVGTAIKLFDYACGGNAYVEDLVQADVNRFVELCQDLPNRWGRTTAERNGGIAASIARARTLPQDKLGIGQETINKHITWIEAVLDHVAGEDDEDGHRPVKPLSFKRARKGFGKKARQARKRDRDKRANWTKEEVRMLLSAPIWSGAAGIDDRLTPGTEIIHDAWYWLPLMLPLYGGRASELSGLGLAEMHETAEIPYFRIEYTEDRPLKTVQSIRRLPIHPELIRLGFLDYVSQIRAQDQVYLFPEMESPKSKSFASTFYKSIFMKWRDWAFPNGTPWRHNVRGAVKDKDVHSFRGFTSSMLKGHVTDAVRCDILGHEGETETARTYDDEAELGIKLKALKLLSPVTAHIEPCLPIRIRPAARMRHGARRGATGRLANASGKAAEGPKLT